MSWVFLDDKFHSNRKILRVGNAGAGVYARSLSYCGDHLTDGFVDEAWVKQACTAKVRDKLVAEGLWVKVDGGFEIPDYLTLNPSREDVLRRRAARSEAGKKGASKRWDSKSHSNGHSNSHSSCNAIAIAKGLGYYQEEGVFSQADEIAMRWLNGAGWDDSFDEAAILEEIGRSIRKSLLRWDGKFSEPMARDVWKQLHAERYPTEAAA